MNPVLVILGMAAVTYASRLAGLLVRQEAVPAGVARTFRFIPMAVFGALVTLSFGGEGSDLELRIPAALVATFVMLRFRQLWAGLAAGMGLYLLARAF